MSKFYFGMLRQKVFFLCSFLQLQQSSLEETNEQTCAEEESAKVFLEEILTEVCRDANKRQTEHGEYLRKVEGTEDSNSSSIEGKAKHFLSRELLSACMEHFNIIKVELPHTPCKSAPRWQR